ncbi:hypothetical protein Tco_0490466 [Tanacetum coccineum]
MASSSSKSSSTGVPVLEGDRSSSNVSYQTKLKKKFVKRIVEKRVAKAIEEYEKTRADSNNTGGSGSANTGGTVAPDVQGCSYKTFMNGKPHSFSGTEGVVGLKRWFEKMEQVFEICKCAEDDKVKFAVCTFESRALTWWNGNVQTLGLANANQIPRDDIEAYNNRFHELVLMCPELVSTKKKKIEKVQAKALRIGDSNKRKWEDQQGNNHSPAAKPRTRVLRFMWQPQLRVEATLGTYHGAIGARHIIARPWYLLGVGKCTSLGHRKGSVASDSCSKTEPFRYRCDNALIVGFIGTTGVIARFS